MIRSGLIIALAFAAVGGLLFGLFPDLDFAIARHFHDNIDGSKNVFAWRIHTSVMNARNVGIWIAAMLVVPAVCALLAKLIMPRRRMFLLGRAVLFLVATSALAPGLMANVVLKEHWSRPRPIDVVQLGGTKKFVAWWDTSGDCSRNCSFVSGDVAGAAWTFAPAALAPPQWRALAYAGAFALTAGMSAIRVMAGAHFLSDVLFAGVFTFLIVWLMHGLIYRWPRTRLSDASVENVLAQAGVALRDVLSLLGGRRSRANIEVSPARPV
jgi:membrane-associated PAP2 superfamily phosphatase